jgi:hypothetical protein
MADLRRALLPVVERARAIPGALGLRRYRVWVRIVEWSGDRVGVGSSSYADTELLVGGSGPKVKQVQSRDVVASGGELSDVMFDIGPLTPEFAGGGIDPSVFNPPKGSRPMEIYFRVVGPGVAAWCQRVSDSTDRNFRYTLRVKQLGVALESPPEEQ